MTLLATPARGASPGAADPLRNVRVTNKVLAGVAVITVAALIVVARRRILFE